MKQMLHSRRSFLKGIAGAASAALFARAFGLAQTKPEVGSLVVAPQFGIAYLPLHVIKAEKLLEKHLTKNGLPNSKVDWVQTTGGAAANEALLSGNVHIVSGGVGPLLTIWDRTKGNADVKGIGCFDATALYLNTINPHVKTLKDFTDKDRIALPAVKISIQAVTLQMACEKEFGAGQHTKLDYLNVSMSHPDATAALLSGKFGDYGAPDQPAVPVPAARGSEGEEGVQLLRRAGWPGDVQLGLHDVEVPQREPAHLQGVR
jgi:NitT/TauT family transport system substrate-binding protein